MELLILLVIALFIGKAFGRKKGNDRTDEPVVYTTKKKKGCSSRFLTFVVWGFVVIVIGAFMSSLDGEIVDTSEPSPAPTAVLAIATAAPTIAPTAETTATPTIAPTIAPTAEPSTLQEWAESVAQAEYGSFDNPYTKLISVECMQVDGESAPMIIINIKYPDTFMRNNDARMSGFLFSVMNVNWKFADLAKQGKIEYGSVFIHGRSMFADNYGNEFEADAAQIRIKASEAAKVNWGYDTVTGDMMPKIAVSFGMQPVIRDGLSPSYYNSIKK